MDNLFENVSPAVIQKHVEGRGLLNACQLASVHVLSRTLQFVRLANHVTLHFNNNMSMAAVSLQTEKALDTTWHHGLLYKLSKLELSTPIIKLISSFPSQRKFRVSVEGEMSVPKHMHAGMPHGPDLSPTLYNSYTCWRHLYIFDRQQGGLCSQKTPARVKINGSLVWPMEYENQCRQARVIYFYHRIRPSDLFLTLNGRNIPF
jgi:hypothetical protein